jgi:hypothetical protein
VKPGPSFRALDGQVWFKTHDGPEPFQMGRYRGLEQSNQTARLFNWLQKICQNEPNLVRSISRALSPPAGPVYIVATAALRQLGAARHAAGAVLTSRTEALASAVC